MTRAIEDEIRAAAEVRDQPVGDARVTIRDCNGKLYFRGKTDADGIAMRAAFTKPTVKFSWMRSARCWSDIGCLNL